MGFDLTPKAVAYCLHEEGMVLEAYKDSVGVWTWAGGVTNASGHEVYPRYLDKPQTLARCLEVTIWLMKQKYLPSVDQAFAGHNLNEAQVAAALSFHWNTGAIKKAEWVKAYCAGRVTSARDLIMSWSSHGLLTARRQREQKLFFDGRWPTDLRVPVYGVRKPAYVPHGAKSVDLLSAIQQVMGGS